MALGWGPRKGPRPRGTPPLRPPFGFLAAPRPSARPPSGPFGSNFPGIRSRFLVPRPRPCRGPPPAPSRGAGEVEAEAGLPLGSMKTHPQIFLTAPSISPYGPLEPALRPPFSLKHQ